MIHLPIAKLSLSIQHLFLLAFEAFSPFSTEIDFSGYVNKPERQLVDDTDANWVRSDFSNAYKCEGTQIKTKPELLSLLPRNGQFMITYIYSRPSTKDLFAYLKSHQLRPQSSNAVLDFIYSQDKDTEFRIFLWREGQPSKKMEEIWSNKASVQTNGLVTSQAQLRNLRENFIIVFAAKVHATYQYTFRTYLSQVVLSRAIVSYV